MSANETPYSVWSVKFGHNFNHKGLFVAPRGSDNGQLHEIRGSLTTYNGCPTIKYSVSDRNLASFEDYAQIGTIKAEDLTEITKICESTATPDSMYHDGIEPYSVGQDCRCINWVDKVLEELQRRNVVVPQN